MNQEKINRINELYKKQKAGTITPEEKEEQSALFVPSILQLSATICEIH